MIRPRGMADMRVYLLSLGAGLLVGIVYSLLNVRSPAPPVVALVGLFGILIGEQIIPVAKHMLDGSQLAAAWRQSHGRGTSSACCPAATSRQRNPTSTPNRRHRHDQTSTDRRSDPASRPGHDARALAPDRDRASRSGTAASSPSAPTRR